MFGRLVQEIIPAIFRIINSLLMAAVVTVLMVSDVILVVLSAVTRVRRSRFGGSCSLPSCFLMPFPGCYGVPAEFISIISYLLLTQFGLSLHMSLEFLSLADVDYNLSLVCIVLFIVC